MRRLILGLFLLAVLGGIGLVGFAYLGNLEPIPNEVTQPVTLNVD